jgi:MinD superfamily P-loop ATPase
MKIAITGGKGGTGKSTIATALAGELAKTKKVLLVDLDVDCPNDELILSIRKKKVKDVKTMVPKFNQKKCIKCGTCSKVCKEKAIVFVEGRFPILVPDQCTGCKACKISCPAGAISEEKQVIGYIFEGKKGNIDFVGGEIKPGIEESSLVVNGVKDFIKDREKDYEHVIIDTAAGMHCPVIAALLGAELGIAVTEPTPLGKHDSGLILELMKKLKIKSKIILNRADIASKKEIKNLSRKYQAEIIAEIPFRKEIAEQYAQGEEIKIPEIKGLINKIIKKGAE